MQGVRPFSTKKLAKINMPTTLSGFGKARKVKNILSKMDNYYDIQMLEEDVKFFYSIYPFERSRA